MSKNILFLAHVSEAGNTLPKASYEVLGAALELRNHLDGHLTIGLIGADVSAAAETVAARWSRSNSGGCGAGLCEWTLRKRCRGSGSNLPVSRR